MRRYSFGLALLLSLFLGCSGENVVAGPEKTQVEQLESALPSWCQSTCARLRACPENTSCDCDGDVCDCIGIDDGCEQQCPLSFAPYTTGSESCAAIGQRIKGCIDGIMCADLGAKSDACRASAAERAACPDPNDLDDNDVPPTGNNSPSGNPGGASPVTCADSTASSSASPPAIGARVTCEEGRDGCSDGHVYSWICSQDSQGQRACACLVDSQATASFVPNSSDCPLLAHVNAGCAWGLTQ